MSTSKRQLSRFAAIFAGGTLLSRVLGLVRDMVLGALIPAVSRDAFFFAFKLPNMLRDMLGEGATNAAFVPVFAESHEKDSPEAYRELISACMSAMLLIFGVLTLLGVLIMPYVPQMLTLARVFTGSTPKDAATLHSTVRLLQGIFPYLFLIGMAVFAMAPLFIAKHYATPSWSPLLLNVALILSCLALRNYFEEPAWALVIGVWLGGLAQLGVMYAALYRKVGVIWPNFRLRHPGIRKVFWLLGPVIVGQATGEVNKLVDSFFAYSLESGCVSALFYANRLVQLPLSVFGIAVAAAILPAISRAGAHKRHEEIRDTLLYGLRQTFFLIAPAMVGLMLVGEPVIRLLFEHGHFDAYATQRTSIALVYYAMGLLAFAWVKVSVQGFYAVQDTVTPVIVASASMFLNILLNCMLVGPMGFRGLALSTTISFTLNFCALYLLLWAKFGALWNRDFGVALLKIAFAVGGMAVVTYGAVVRLERMWDAPVWWQELATVIVPISLAALVYTLLCRALRLKEITDLMRLFSR